MSKQNNQSIASTSKKPNETKVMSLDVPTMSQIDILSVLSHITVKVPLLELLRILEHRDKAIAWIGGVNDELKLSVIQIKPLRVKK